MADIVEFASTEKKRDQHQPNNNQLHVDLISGTHKIPIKLIGFSRINEITIASKHCCCSSSVKFNSINLEQVEINFGKSLHFFCGVEKQLSFVGFEFIGIS